MVLRVLEIFSTRECSPGFVAVTNLLQSMGVRDREINPESSIEQTMTTANSWKRRPTTPPMNRRGMKIELRERVIDMMVKLICLEPSRAAWRAVFPISRWRDYIFENDDGVVDEKSDRKGDGEKREDIDRVSEDRHERTFL